MRSCHVRLAVARQVIGEVLSNDPQDVGLSVSGCPGHRTEKQKKRKRDGPTKVLHRSIRRLRVGRSVVVANPGFYRRAESLVEASRWLLPTVFRMGVILGGWYRLFEMVVRLGFACVQKLALRCVLACCTLMDSANASCSVKLLDLWDPICVF